MGSDADIFLFDFKAYQQEIGRADSERLSAVSGGTREASDNGNAVARTEEGLFSLHVLLERENIEVSRQWPTLYFILS